jgi:hypothetical protein
MAYIKCRGCGLCLKCIVTNYCKHVYVNDLGGFLILGFRRVLDIVFFLLGKSAASVCYWPKFRNSRAVPSS